MQRNVATPSTWAIFAFLGFLCFTGMCSAHTLGAVNTKCPLCGAEFKYTAAMSGTSFGSRLDFKEVGAIYQPWPIPQCPECRYAFFNGEETLSPAIKRLLGAYIESPDFKDIPEKAPSYFYLARFMELLEKPQFNIAFTYLKASWQAEGTEALDDGRIKLGWTNDPAMNKLALQEALRCMESVGENDTWVDQLTALYLKVELNRRLESFTAAEESLRKIRAKIETAKRENDHGGLSPDQIQVLEGLPQYLDCQERLIADGDAAPALLEMPAPANDAISN